MRPALAPLAALIFFAVAPAEGLPRLPLCGFHWLTGHPCPLCGLTRALCHLLKGHWQAALALHALSPLALGVLAALVVEAFRPLPPGLWRRAGPAALVVLAGYGALRLVV